MMTASQWRAMKVSDLGRVVTGKTPPTVRPELFGAQHPFITPTDIDGVNRAIVTARYVSDAGAEAFPNQMIPEGSVCFVCIGATIGKMCIASRCSLTNQQVNSIVVDTRRHDPRFVFYLLRQIAPNVKSLAGGAAMPIISKSSFSDITVKVPPLEMQSRIASILSAYDDLIENNTRRIAILEEMARRIYEEWFVHFRFPGHEHLRMVESELGSVPDGWSICSLGQLVSLNRGLSYKGSGLSESGVPMVNLKNIAPGGGFRRGMLKFYTDTYKQRHTVLPGDIVLANTDLKQAGTVIGSPARVPDLGTGPVIFSHHLYAIRLTALPRSTIPYIYYLLAHPSFKAFAKGHASGTTVLGLHEDGVENYPFACPPESLMAVFSAKVGSMTNLSEMLHRQNANLRTTRDLLLPRLISGELDVSALPEPEAVAA